MEDKLKQFIDTHREEFEDIKLPEGHFERFNEKLPKKKRNSQIRIFSLLTAAIAACIALLLLFKNPFGLDDATSSPYICEMKKEIEELQLFYRMQMNDAITQMEEMYNEDRTPGAAELLKETKKVQLASIRFEEKILPSLPCSDQAIFAVNQHYSNSLKSINIMLECMGQVIEIE